jgi:ribonuclease P protein component
MKPEGLGRREQPAEEVATAGLSSQEQPADEAATAGLSSQGQPARGAVSESFPRRLRLRQRREFLRVQRSGAKHHTRFFLVFVAPSALRGRPGAAARAEGLPGTRLGVTVTRKVGKAVKRNRIKRLVREVFRRERHALPAGLDMVWVAKRDAVETTYEGVVQDMRALASRLQDGAGSRRARPPKPAAKETPTPARSR